MDLRNNAQCFWYFNDIFHENTITCFNVVHHFLIPVIKGQFYSIISFFTVSPLKVIIISTHVKNINIELE